MADLIEHLESFLGTMSGGSRGDETTPDGVQVAWFPGAPFAGVTSLVTLGLSRHHLGSPEGGAVHQELMMHVPDGEYPARAAGLLFQVAGEMVARQWALPRGQVIGPRGPLFPGSRMTAVVALDPGYLPADFAVWRAGDSVTVFLTWLVPITGGEAEAVRQGGSHVLEHAVAARDPDLTDPRRPQMAWTRPGS